MRYKLEVRDWHWEITRNCNLKCLHCITGDNRNRELTTLESLKAISRIVRLGGKNLSITGGEPFARNDLGLIIKEAHVSGLGLGLISNGTMIGDAFLKKYGRYINRMAISIDGQKQIHEQIRGCGSHEKSMLAIRKIIDSGIDLSVYITIHSLNESSIDKLLEELITIGIRSFHFNEINLGGRVIENQYLLLDQKNAADRFACLLHQLKKSVDVGKVASDISCSISPNTAYLQSDGKIFACVELAFKAPDQMIAHILGQEIEEKMDRFFSDISSSAVCKCPYVSFYMQGISAQLNESNECPMIRS